MRANATSTAQAHARILRRRTTDAEQQLWQRLRSRQIAGAKFRRQHPIGAFVADFCCVEAHLVVEIDGGQHAERAREDEQRTTYMAAHGYRVIRFWNNEVLQSLDSVLRRIEAELKR